MASRPWEQIASHPVAEQISAIFDREEAGRQPPYGQALDLGCGSGIWSVKLAARGWEVTGVDVVSKAVRRARKRARAAGVEPRFIEGDVTALRAAEVGSGFRLLLDFGTVHGLNEAQVKAVGRAVSEVAAEDATLLMLAAKPARRGPLPRGINRAEIEAAFPGWKVIDEEAADVSGRPHRLGRRSRASTGSVATDLHPLTEAHGYCPGSSSSHSERRGCSTGVCSARSNRLCAHPLKERVESVPPFGVYSIPEVSMVGLTEEAAAGCGGRGRDGSLAICP